MGYNENDDEDSNLVRGQSEKFENSVVGVSERKFERKPDHIYVSINNDVYTLFFLSKTVSFSSLYVFYVYFLKITLYVFIAIDAAEAIQNIPDDVDDLVLTAQFLMLPVAVAIQADLMSVFYHFGNIEYCDSVEQYSPYVAKWKLNVANLLRLTDGLFSLIINFMVLVTAESVLGLMLNFAALQFLQTIDDVALQLAADGYLWHDIERLAEAVLDAELPEKNDASWVRSLDTVLFVFTLISLMVFWILFSFSEFAGDETEIEQI